MDEKKSISKKIPPEVIERDIEKTRKKMSNTINEIEERFSAEHWKAIVKDTIRDKKDAAVSRGKEFANKVKESSLRAGNAAGDRSLRAKDDVLRFMKEKPYAAGAIAFELGAWIVIASQTLMSRRREVQRKKEPGEYAKVKIMTIEEVEQKVEKAALAPEQDIKKAA